MLTMIVYYHCKDGLRDAFMTAVKMEKIAENSRVEPGNMQYDYFLPVDDANIVLLLEKWESDEAQKIHTATVNFKKLGEIKAKFVESVEIEKY